MLVVLTLMGLAILVTGAVIVGHFRGLLDRAEERNFLQAWQLRQLLPESARGGIG
jgi:serine/threonine-protein kinase